MYMPKVGIRLLLISYFLPESFVLASARTLFLVMCPCFLLLYSESGGSALRNAYNVI